MLTLAKYFGTAGLVLYDAPEKEYPEITDWNVQLSTFSTARQAYITIPAGWSERQMVHFLSKRPDACIYNTVANRPIMGTKDTVEQVPLLISQQWIVINGRPYIDLRGLYVYIASRVAWDIRSDVDLRFSANQYPYHLLGCETEQILNADYDILDRTSA